MLNGGPFQFSGQLDRSGEELTLEAKFRAEKVVLDDGMRLLRYAVPVLAGVVAGPQGAARRGPVPSGQRKDLGDDEPHARRAMGWSRSTRSIWTDRRSSRSFRRSSDLKRQGRIASIKTDFVISNRRVTTDHFVLDVGRVPLALSGWTDFDGNARLPDQSERSERPASGHGPPLLERAERRFADAQGPHASGARSTRWSCS